MSASDALTVISEDIYGARTTFDACLVDRSLSFEREAGFAIQLLGANKFSMDTAMKNRQSVVDAVVNIAAIGISLNPAKKQAYLVPRDGKICLDLSYIGLLALAEASGAIQWGQARLVHEADVFELNGLDKMPDHRYKPFSKDRGEVVGVYVTVKTSSGDYLTETMAIDEVLSIRDRSAAWKSSKSGPWKTDEGEMTRKTVIKRAYKQWPKSDRLDKAIHHLNTENGEGLAVLADESKPAKAIGVHISPLGDVWATIPEQRKQIIEAVASAVTDLFHADDVVGAYGECEGITDGDEKVALWKLLPSNIRSAIKKHAISLREATPA